MLMVRLIRVSIVLRVLRVLIRLSCLTWVGFALLACKSLLTVGWKLLCRR